MAVFRVEKNSGYTVKYWIKAAPPSRGRLMNWTRRGCWNGNGAASPHRTGFMSKYRQCHRYSFQTN